MLGKILLIVTVLVAIVAYKVNNIYVIEGFENPTRYKIGNLILSSIAITSTILDKLNIVGKYAGFRNTFNYVIKSNIPPEQTLIDIQNKMINGLNVRIYAPKVKTKKDPSPLLIYIHGGGFFLGNLNTYDLYLYKMVEKIEDLTVMSIDYRKAPEHPYPTPTDDCYAVIKYILEHAQEFDVDVKRLLMAGDSAGGNSVLVMSQKLLKDNSEFLPKLNILIYPWLHVYGTMLPSSLRYVSDLLNVRELALWYLGYSNYTQEMDNSIYLNHLITLLDKKSQSQIENCLNSSLLPVKHRTRDYYKKENLEALINTRVPSYDESMNILKKDKNFAKRVKLLFNEDISPGLMNDEQLKKLPHTYEIVCEWDSLKDENLIFGERLKNAGVKTKVAFYDTCYHGMIQMIDKYELSKKIQDDLINYIKEHIL